MSQPTPDRNLLLGALAVRNDLVTPEALAAAVSEWERDGSRSLGQVLLARGYLRERDIGALEALADHLLERNGADRSAGTLLTSAVRQPSNRESGGNAGTLGEAADEAPPTVMPTDEQTAAAAAGLAAPRYRVLRPHAKGGLGEVFVALDEELQREVALKEIQAKHADNTESRQRFLLEAEITGRLEHPGIVPVYGLGAYADGRPYYAMRFIKGDSLLHALRRFHADDSLKTDPGKRALELRQLLGRFQAVCNAIAYAHSKGVLHRDLKPDNVMLGNYGETLVVDWGLAKAIGAREEVTPTGSLTLRLSGPDSGLTQAGHVLGTPAYMSPEQASGQNAELSPASDVYSLGATLYHLLTGRPPFVGTNAYAILEGVCRGQFPRPREVDPTVPAALEAVCLKAMALRSQDRYASAKDLAEDIEHWLADEPVAAYREPLRQRLGRWRRRHPALVTGTAALAFAALVALGVGSLLLSQEQGRTLQEQQAKLAEQDKRALAQVNALLDASPQAVPNILQGLEDYRDQVRPRLRQVLEQSPSVQHRTRAALALLAEDPSQVTLLRRRLLAADVDPEEMLLLRDRLADHKKTLAKDLWGEVDRRGVPAETRFRALVALARFDPNSPRWATAGKQAVGPLVTAEPVYVGIWSRGLRDVRTALLAPLGAVFRDRGRPAERRVAASVLQDYAADRPEVLADLLVDADPQQYAVLFPRLQAHRDRAVSLLQAELARGAGRWPAGAEAGQRPAPRLIEELDKAQGMVAEHFALCQALPLERWPAVAEALGRSGYRPLKCRPYTLASEVLVAAVWARDGRAWRMGHGLSAAEVRRRDAAQRKDGYRPVDVAGYRSGDGERYTVLWSKPAADEDSRLYVGIPEAEHKTDGWGPLHADKYVPLAYHVFLAGDGKRRYSAVWGKKAKQPAFLDTFGSDEHDYETKAGPDKVAWDVCLFPAPPVDNRKHQAELLATAEKEVEAKPKDGPAIYQRGLARYRVGQDARALPDLDATVKKYPTFADGYRYRALVQARLGHAEQARADLAAFLKLSTQPGTKAAVAAVVAAYLGEDDGLKRLDEVLASQPKDADLLYNAACAYAVAGRAAWHRQRLQSAAAALATWPAPGSWTALPWALPAVPGRLTRIDAKQQTQVRKRTARALDLLRQALAHGYADYAHMQTDEDLDGLRAEPAFAALLQRGHLERRYAAVWQTSITRESAESHGLEAADHLRRCRALAKEGYRPVSLSVCQTQPGQPPLTASVWQRPLATETARDALAQRQANAAATLLRLGEVERVWPLFQHTPHPDTRTHLLHRLAPLEVNARRVVERLEKETDVSARRALVLSLGEFDERQLPAERRRLLLPRLLGWYRDDPDPGIHAAVDWLLRHGQEGPLPRKIDWGQAKELHKIDEQARGAGRWPAGARAGQRPAPRRRWLVNGQGQTMVLFPGPVEFLMGSPESEAGRSTDELLHRRRIGRSFALASKKVTVAQFRRFLKAHPEVKHFFTQQYSPDKEGPVVGVTWYEAAQYCRWLSEQEGVAEEQMCYPSVAAIEKCKDGVTPLKLPKDYLSRSGYRLPSEAEWEYACRADSRSSRYYGSSEEMLGRYGWYIHNAQDRAWPVGQKKPNDFGLFDMHGNTWDWCQESGWQYVPGKGGKPAEDEEDKRDIVDRLSRALRGGSFLDQPSNLRSAQRFSNRPTFRSSTVGLRLARTLP